MTMRLRLILMFMLFIQPFALHAVQVDEILPNPALEHRARELSAQLRCLVCQNQSIDDSDAPLARDLRILVREHRRDERRQCGGDAVDAVRVGDTADRVPLAHRRRADRGIECVGRVQAQHGGLRILEREALRERLVAGDSDEAVKAYLVKRYGAFILLQPPFTLETYLLWLFPVICLVAGGLVVLASRRSGANVALEPMSPEDEARLRHILDPNSPE